jgi:plasmid stability protein
MMNEAMRTTLNLDDDVARPLTQLARRSHRSLSRVANDLLREGLRASQKAARPKPFVPVVFDSGDPLIDVTNIGEALEILDRG